jgi:hypothetical protein
LIFMWSAEWAGRSVADGSVSGPRAVVSCAPGESLGPELAAQFEDLAVCGFEGLPELLDLVAVSLFERAQLDGQGADDTARVVVARCARRRGRGVLLLRSQLFHALPDRCAAVK